MLLPNSMDRIEFGTPLFKSVYVVLDQDHQRVGYGRYLSHRSPAKLYSNSTSDSLHPLWTYLVTLVFLLILIFSWYKLQGPLNKELDLMCCGGIVTI